jgi:thiamine biosynthesis protein ThiI
MKFVSLVSSGIDSPVATYLLSRHGADIILVHGDGRPFTDDLEIENFIRLAKHLKIKTNNILKAFIIPHGDSLKIFKQKCKQRYVCILCKRMLVRYAEEIAEKEKAEAIIMGDSLGQVASQTLQNLRAVEDAVDIPILRPLIGLDKEDIIQIAKKIGTYNLSIMPSAGCKAVPSKPATKARLEDVLAEEKKIDVKKLLGQAIKKAELISL